MALSTSVKHWINLPLAKLNVRLETLTASKLEKERIRKLIASGHFDTPAFPLLKSFASFDGRAILEGYVTFREGCERLTSLSGSVRYNPLNEYFPPADACPTYLVA